MLHCCSDAVVASHIPHPRLAEFVVLLSPVAEAEAVSEEALVLVLAAKPLPLRGRSCPTEH